MRHQHCAILSAIYNTETDLTKQTVRGTEDNRWEINFDSLQVYQLRQKSEQR